MKYLVFVLMIVLAVNSFAQVPLFGTQRTEGYQCPIQSMTNSDSTKTSPILYYRDGKIFTGAASLVGHMDLTAGTDTLVNFYMRQVMHSNPAIDNAILYDSTDWRKIKAQTGDYIPAEDAVGATAIPISINLANQPFWMPSIGIQVEARMPMGATRTKRLELYIVTTKESN
jgi:hypothetical protein